MSRKKKDEMAASLSSSAMHAPRTLVVDNGGGRVKAGWSSSASSPPSLLTLPNCTAKIHKTLETLTADEMDALQGPTSQLRFSRPFDRGYLTNWNVEVEIWQRLLSREVMDASPSECNLVLTVPPFCPEELQRDTNEVLFEEMGFHSVLCKSPMWFSSYHFTQEVASPNYISPNSDASSNFRECNLVVDSGFSFSHSIPLVNGMVRGQAARRVNVGGKLLTNYLKEVISYRQWNFMDEFLLVDQVKEALCFVSQDFDADLTRCQRESPNMQIPKQSRPRAVNHHNSTNSNSNNSNSNHNNGSNSDSNGSNDSIIKQEGEAMSHLGNDDEGDDSDPTEDDDQYEFLKKFFVLPDYHNVMSGFVKRDGEAFEPHEQVLTMESERFTIPEILFNPSDIGIDQAGIVEAVGQSLNSLNEIEGELCARNIILTGGNASIPGYKERFEKDIRQFIPNHWNVNIYQPDDPSTYAWQGAALFARMEQSAGRFHNYCVNRDEYLEHGHSICAKRFN